MDARADLARYFESDRRRLQTVAYRMLGSVSEAEDAVQETWLKLDRTDAAAIDNLSGWLTTAIARVCLNLLRTRRLRREESLDPDTHMPDPVVTSVDAVDPASRAERSDDVGLAMMVVLDTLNPAERVAFVLHDMFSVPFDEIAPLLEKSADATRQLASRARRRVRKSTPAADRDLARQRTVVDAFFLASRNGDFSALVAVLDPEVVLRSDGGNLRPAQSVTISGAEQVAAQAVTFSTLAPFVRPVLVNGTAGVVVIRGETVVSVMAFTVTDGAIVAIDVLADPERLRDLVLHGM